MERRGSRSSLFSGIRPVSGKGEIESSEDDELVGAGDRVGWQGPA